MIYTTISNVFYILLGSKTGCCDDIRVIKITANQKAAPAKTYFINHQPHDLLKVVEEWLSNCQHLS